MREASYLEVLLDRLLAEPARTVVRRHGYDWTAEHFLERTVAMATWLASQGVGAGTRLGLGLHDNLWSIQSCVACWLLDAEPVLLDHRLASTEVAQWRERLKLQAFVTQQRRLQGQAGVRMMPPVEGLPSLSHWHAQVQQWRTELRTSLEDRVSRYADFIASSGVSGPPKLGANTQAGMLAAVCGMMDDDARGAWGVALSAVSVAFAGGRYVWWRNLLAGVPIHTMDLLFSIGALDRELLDPRVQECTLPPGLIRALTQHAITVGAQVGPRYPHLCKLQSIGGPARAEDKLQAFHQLSNRYLMTYSSTETGVIAHIEGADLLAHPDSCGRVLAGLKVDIVDELGQPCCPGTIGKIRMLQPATGASGTEGGEATTRDVFPGDLGWLDAEGFLYIAARGQGIICRHGVNFSTGELEARILAIDGVRDAAVIRVGAGEDDEDSMVLALDLQEPLSQVRRRLRAALNPHEQPQACWLLNEDDYTVGGKIRRQRLKALWYEAPERFEPF